VLRSPIDPFTPAVELAAAIRRKEVSPLEVVDTCLARIDELDARLNAFCYRVDDDARKAASAAADALVAAASPEDLPPFHGVPLPIKDLLDVAGWPTTHGSAGASPAPAAASDPVVQRFVDAGFVLLGKTTSSEFGTVPFTENEALGISRNPWDPDRTPGGSSSGAGAAVAAGMAPIAHAADGGGSIRIPASCNGLVGLKPTRGLVTNVTVDLEGLATNGVLTRSVADTAAAMDVLARHDPAAWWSPPTPSIPFASAVTMASPTGLRIGAITDPAIDGLSADPACAAAVDATLRTLESAGHHVVDTPLPLPPTDILILGHPHDHRPAPVQVDNHVLLLVFHRGLLPSSPGWFAGPECVPHTRFPAAGGTPAVRPRPRGSGHRSSLRPAPGPQHRGPVTQEAALRFFMTSARPRDQGCWASCCKRRAIR
jgi:amidase